MLKRLDHVNVYTADLKRMVAWYGDVLGMQEGPRPPFSFTGAWLYVGEAAVVHMTELERPRANDEPGIEHFALTAEDIGRFLDHLEARSVPYRIAIVPGFEVIQVNIHDPDGNHIHIDFAKEERAALDGRQVQGR